jgi:hypothetical protein
MGEVGSRLLTSNVARRRLIFFANVGQTCGAQTDPGSAGASPCRPSLLIGGKGEIKGRILTLDIVVGLGAGSNTGPALEIEGTHCGKS